MATVFVVKVYVAVDDVRRKTLNVASLDAFAFEHLCQVVLGLAPEADIGKLRWEDSEGLVSLRNEEDLREAMANLLRMNDGKDVLRIHVTTCSTANKKTKYGKLFQHSTSNPVAQIAASLPFGGCPIEENQTVPQQNIIGMAKTTLLTAPETDQNTQSEVDPFVFAIKTEPVDELPYADLGACASQIDEACCAEPAGTAEVAAKSCTSLQIARVKSEAIDQSPIFTGPGVLKVEAKLEEIVETPSEDSPLHSGGQESEGILCDDYLRSPPVPVVPEKHIEGLPSSSQPLSSPTEKQNRPTKRPASSDAAANSRRPASVDQFAPPRSKSKQSVAPVARKVKSSAAIRETSATKSAAANPPLPRGCILCQLCNEPVKATSKASHCRKHAEFFQYQCPLCPYKSRWSSTDIRRHIVGTHPGHDPNDVKDNGVLPKKDCDELLLQCFPTRVSVPKRTQDVAAASSVPKKHAGLPSSSDLPHVRSSVGDRSSPKKKVAVDRPTCKQSTPEKSVASKRTAVSYRAVDKNTASPKSATKRMSACASSSSVAVGPATRQARLASLKRSKVSQEKKSDATSASSSAVSKLARIIPVGPTTKQAWLSSIKRNEANQKAKNAAATRDPKSLVSSFVIPKLTRIVPTAQPNPLLQELTAKLASSSNKRASASEISVTTPEITDRPTMRSPKCSDIESNRSCHGSQSGGAVMRAKEPSKGALKDDALGLQLFAELSPDVREKMVLAERRCRESESDRLKRIVGISRKSVIIVARGLEICSMARQLKKAAKTDKEKSLGGASALVEPTGGSADTSSAAVGGALADKIVAKAMSSDAVSVSASDAANFSSPMICAADLDQALSTVDLVSPGGRRPVVSVDELSSVLPSPCMEDASLADHNYGGGGSIPRSSNIDEAFASSGSSYAAEASQMEVQTASSSSQGQQTGKHLLSNIGHLNSIGNPSSDIADSLRRWRCGLDVPPTLRVQATDCNEASAHQPASVDCAYASSDHKQPELLQDGGVIRCKSIEVKKEPLASSEGCDLVQQRHPEGELAPQLITPKIMDPTDGLRQPMDPVSATLARAKALRLQRSQTEAEKVQHPGSSSTPQQLIPKSVDPTEGLRQLTDPVCELLASAEALLKLKRSQTAAEEAKAVHAKDHSGSTELTQHKTTSKAPKLSSSRTVTHHQHQMRTADNQRQPKRTQSGGSSSRFPQRWRPRPRTGPRKRIPVRLDDSNYVYRCVNVPPRRRYSDEAFPTQPISAALGHVHLPPSWFSGVSNDVIHQVNEGNLGPPVAQQWQQSELIPPLLSPPPVLQPKLEPNLSFPFQQPQSSPPPVFKPKLEPRVSFPFQQQRIDPGPTPLFPPATQQQFKPGLLPMPQSHIAPQSISQGNFGASSSSSVALPWARVEQHSQAEVPQKQNSFADVQLVAGSSTRHGGPSERGRLRGGGGFSGNRGGRGRMRGFNARKHGRVDKWWLGLPQGSEAYAGIDRSQPRNFERSPNPGPW